ncbi:MAG TPA: hypothetical protein DCG53_05100 [Syntrophus sp. (in: bacteria)]|jgi:hypothetical protein|nr:hypothetical protein [Syntrophus sp. (in: bacteria)]
MQYSIDVLGGHISQIAGALIMACIVAYLAGFNNRRNRCAVAAEKFRNAFYNELKGLYPTPTDLPKDFHILDNRLRKSFMVLQCAVDEFKHFIPWYRRWFFFRAWHRYRLGKDGRDIDQQYYGQYKSGETVTSNQHGKEIIEITDGKKNFKHNVDRLMKYARTL